MRQHPRHSVDRFRAQTSVPDSAIGQLVPLVKAIRIRMQP